MKYPNILFLRYIEYEYIDNFFEFNKNNLQCNINIICDKNELNKLFDPNYPILVTFGKLDLYMSDVNSVISDRMRKRWIHYNEINDINAFNREVNYCFMNIVRNTERVIFSLFTTCYNSYEKIHRAYNSIKEQTFKDFEWVILDDSPNDDHFNFLKNLFKNDKRIRLYKRDENSGNIGNVKNEAVLLCRGKYVLEMDHDDEIVPDLIKNAVDVFEKDSEIGFIYMDYCNIYEDGRNFKYGNCFSLGYSGYYCVKYKNKWIYVACTPNINNITLSNIVSVPNHPRIWRKSLLIEIGNYSEFLPVCDDYELLIKTALKTKIARIHKLGYIQYMNQNNNNFSLIRNGEITRLTNQQICPSYYKFYNIHNEMKNKNAYENEEYLCNRTAIWKRKNYSHKFCNTLHNVDHKKQYCIIGCETLESCYDYIKNVYDDLNNDFIVLDNKIDIDALIIIIEKLGFDRMKCYALNDCTIEELENYFNILYKSCSDYEIIHNVNLNKSIKKLTIITPSIRPNNLLKIKESINFDYVDKWMIIYDGKKINENPNLFKDNDKIIEYVYKDDNSTSGNSQRNYAVDNISNQNTYLYFLDDDNIIHPQIYKLLDKVEDNKLYTFNQKRPIEIFPHTELLKGNKVELYTIDTAMFLIDYNLCKNIRWNIEKYNADGYYIVECYNNNKDKWIYIDELMAYYNYLQ